MIRLPALCAAAAFACLAAAPAVSTEATREIHGSSDAFAMPGMALAWAVLRTPKEDDTAVVIRIEVDAQAYAWIEVVGKDPFTQRETRWQPPTSVGGPFDLKLARSGFADFPRTEFRLWESGPTQTAGPPALVVYYAGVPDTTPEVARAADLDRSLSVRVLHARDEASRRAP